MEEAPLLSVHEEASDIVKSYWDQEFQDEDKHFASATVVAVVDEDNEIILICTNSLGP